LSNSSHTRKVQHINCASTAHQRRINLTKEIGMQANPNKTALILGANGRLGRTVLDAFIAAGWDVLAQARRPIENLPPQVRQMGIDMSNTEAIVRAAHGASIVVYAVNPVYTEWDEKLLPLARQGMNIAERLGALFMLPGNVYNFGEKMPERLVESTMPRPTTKKGHQREALEGEMQTRIQRGLRSVVIRAGDFFGSGTGNWFDQAIVKSIKSGKLVYPGPTDVVHAWAYLPDLARAFVGVAELDLAGNLNAPVMRHYTSATASTIGSFKKIHFAGHNISGDELLAAIETAAERLDIAKGPFKRSGMPWWLIRLVGVVNPMWRELAKMSYLWRVPHAVESTSVADLLPELTQTPLDVAIRASLEALGHGRAVPNTTPPAQRLATSTSR
jgi:nucleoside-diphosphate-sugar epimerase